MEKLHKFLGVCAPGDGKRNNLQNSMNTNNKHNKSGQINRVQIGGDLKVHMRNLIMLGVVGCFDENRRYDELGQFGQFYMSQDTN